MAQYTTVLNTIGRISGAASNRRKNGSAFATSTAFPTTNAVAVATMKPAN